jgi:hypothetical protein
MAKLTSADLTPHPLVAAIAVGLIDLKVPLIESAADLVTAEKNVYGNRSSESRELARAETSLTNANEQATRRASGTTVVDMSQVAVPVGFGNPAAGQGNARVDNFAALVLAGASNVPKLVSFAGYVGGRFHKQETEWCVFYLNTRLTTWLLVDTDGIVFRESRKEEQAPCGLRDVIWVKADTPVGLGNASEAAQAQFLTGEFTSAGDIDAPAAGGTLDAATGVFCEARSVGCCKNNTTSKYCKG